MKKIVIIDEDPIDRFVIKHAMRGKNYFDTTTYTVDGTLVLDYIEENRSDPEKLPDVILLDLNMTHSNGWEFLDRLQAMCSSICKNIKVHVLSSSARRDIKEHAEQYPFVKSFISRPLEADMIEKIAQKPFAL